MKKVCTLLQIVLLTTVVQAVSAQDVKSNAAQVATVKTLEETAKSTSEIVYEKKYTGAQLEKVPTVVAEAFKKKYSDAAVIKEVDVTSSGVHKVIALKDGKEVVAYFMKNGAQAAPVRAAKNSSLK